jgi:hypothetical protein
MKDAGLVLIALVASKTATSTADTVAGTPELPLFPPFPSPPLLGLPATIVDIAAELMEKFVEAAVVMV